MKKAKAKTPTLHRQQTVSEAFSAILSHNLAQLAVWEPVARSWEDIEGVHQLRVSCRRMRSALRVFRAAVPKSVSADWGAELGWLAGQLGPARDLDVFISESLQAVAGKLPLPGGEPLLALAEARRAVAYETVVALLDSDRYATFKPAFSDWLDRQGWLAGKLKQQHRLWLDSSVVPFARDCLDRQERQVLATGSEVDRESPPAMHQLRIECKRLRYAAEFFGPLFRDMADFIAQLKGLQDLLGVLNDVTVMHRLLDDLPSGQTDPTVLQYAGGLVGWRTCQYHAIKDSFDSRWEAFLTARHPWWSHGALLDDE
jgi:CHAD domain-containing protein